MHTRKHVRTHAHKNSYCTDHWHVMLFLSCSLIKKFQMFYFPLRIYLTRLKSLNIFLLFVNESDISKTSKLISFGALRANEPLNRCFLLPEDTHCRKRYVVKIQTVCLDSLTVKSFTSDAPFHYFDAFYEGSRQSFNWLYSKPPTRQ